MSTMAQTTRDIERIQRAAQTLDERAAQAHRKQDAGAPHTAEIARAVVTPASATTDWLEPQPLPDRLPPVPVFNPQLLPTALRPWIADIAERMQCPIEYPAVGAMVGVASLVGRRVAIRPKQKDDWTIVPNLWGAVVGRPGLLKTPALDEALKPLNRLVAETQKEYARARAEFAALKDERDARGKVLSAELRSTLKGTGERDKDAILADLQGLRTQGEPQERRLLTNDTTVEKLGELLAVNPNGILVFRDELTGWLRTLDREGHEGDRSFYLEAWSGTGSFTYDRIGRGTIHIEAACVSVLGSIQPGPLSDYVRGAAGNGAGADGLLQRFQMLVYPDDPKEWRNVDRWPDNTAKNAAFQTFARLASLETEALGASRDSDGGLPYLRFDGAAQSLFDEWRSELERKLRDDGAEYFEAHLAKYRKLVPALALLIHLVDSTVGGPVDDDAMLRAAAWAEFLETHARRVYAEALNPGAGAAVELARRIRSRDLPETFTPRDVYRNCWHGLDRAPALAAIDRLEALGWLNVEETQTGGRPSTICTVNPRVRV
jgi:putative DNA primase/helicase